MKGVIATLVMLCMVISGSLGISLHEAVRTNNIPEVRRIVEYKTKHMGFFSLTTEDLVRTKEIFEMAVQGRFVQVLEVLLSQPDNLFDMPFPSSLYATLAALQDVEMIRIVIASGYQPSYNQYYNDIRNKRMDVLKIYMEYDLLPYDGLLTRAVRMGDPEVIKLLLRPPIKKKYYIEELEKARWSIPWNNNFNLIKDLLNEYARKYDPPEQYSHDYDFLWTHQWLR